MENINLENKGGRDEEMLEKDNSGTELPKKIEKEIEEIEKEVITGIDTAENDIEEMLKKEGVSPEVHLKTNTILNGLREKLTGKIHKRILTMIAVGAMYFGPGLSESSASNTIDNDLLNNLNKTEASFSTENSMEGGEDTYTEGYDGGDKNPEKNPEGGTNSEKESGSDSEKEKTSSEENQETHIEKIEFDITTSFELGNAVIDESEQEKMQTSITEFFKNLPQEVKDRINNGNSVISINSGCSPELIVETGIESGRGIVHNNIELATERADEGFEKVVEPSLKESGLGNGKVIHTIPEDGIDKDNPVRYVTISIEDAIEVPNDLEIKIKDPGKIKIEIEKIIKDAKWVISDYSPSMEEERKKVESLIKDLNAKSEEKIEEVRLEDGYNHTYEQHLTTINNVLNNVDKPFGETKYMIVYTDEPDYDSDKKTDKKGNQFNYETELQKTIDKAKGLNIEIVLRAFDPKNPGESILKTLEKTDLTKTDRTTSEDADWYKNISS